MKETLSGSVSSRPILRCGAIQRGGGSGVRIIEMSRCGTERADCAPLASYSLTAPAGVTRCAPLAGVTRSPPAGVARCDRLAGVARDRPVGTAPAGVTRCDRLAGVARGPELLAERDRRRLLRSRPHGAACHCRLPTTLTLTVRSACRGCGTPAWWRAGDRGRAPSSRRTRSPDHRLRLKASPRRRRDRR